MAEIKELQDEDFHDEEEARWTTWSDSHREARRKGGKEGITYAINRASMLQNEDKYYEMTMNLL